MVNRHLVILVVIAIINLANCQSYADLFSNIPCHRKPFKRYALECFSNYGISTDLDTCVYTTAGIITEDGRVDAEKFRKIIYSHVIRGREVIADAYMKALHHCADQVGFAKTPEAALKALDRCEDNSKIEGLLKKALCREM